MRRMRFTCSRALSTAMRLSTRCKPRCICSMMSGRDFSNSRRYAQAPVLALAVLCRMSLTIKNLAIFSDMSVSTIVSDSVKHSVISIAISLLSRQKVIASRMWQRAFVTFRSNCSNLSQSLSMRRLPPVSPFLSRSRFWRSCVAFSSRRWRSFSSSMSSGVQLAGTPERAGCSLPLLAPVAGAAAATAAAAAAAVTALFAGGSVGGAEEKLVFRFCCSSTASQGGGFQ
mmetsp:Transcript_14916/g.31231  ORF Transcript_14916/g.31231 Transcript_14916/m.31231 type:complete len:228 (-) Transcript_14916:1341-2024(-)